MDFSPSQRTLDYLERIRAFIRDQILEIEEGLFREVLSGRRGGDWTKWSVSPAVAELKTKARSKGLWNLFLPDPTLGAGLNTVEYAPLAEEMGKSFLAPEIFNCNAPDTGNMEVLWKYGSPEQQQRWLDPLLKGRIRSTFCMTEPDVASSDATNMRATAVVDGGEIVLNGKKWWSSGIGHPDCKVAIFMGLTDPEADRHHRHSMVLVPLDTPGVRIKRMLPVFGHYDEPYGHGEVWFENVRVPGSNFVAGPGRGFEIAQGRLGPGRIHHCMRCIGAAERALQLLTLYAAWKLDQVGPLAALNEISAIKVVAPNVLQRVVDEAIQMHGGAGVSEDVPLTVLFAHARILRIADGPDAVHRGLIAKV